MFVNAVTVLDCSRVIALAQKMPVLSAPTIGSVVFQATAPDSTAKNPDFVNIWAISNCV